MSTAATSHVRVNRGLLAQAERRVLVWVAQRLPSRIHSSASRARTAPGVRWVPQGASGSACTMCPRSGVKTSTVMAVAPCVSKMK